MSTPLLTPQITRQGRWLPFIRNEKNASYAFYLPHDVDNGNGDGLARSSPASDFTSAQLDEWFRDLHPSGYADEPTGHAWTDATYKQLLLLRKTAWCAFDNRCTCEYGYSDTWQPLIQSERMKGVIRGITAAVSKVVGLDDDLNCVNLNYYPTGGGVGFHADDEFLFDGLNRDTRIISLSLCSPCVSRSDSTATTDHRNWGARKFQVKRKGNKYESDISEIILRHGDLITMEGMFQKHYLHSVWPGDSKGYMNHDLCQGERINLTWRTIVRHLDGSSECRGMACPLSKTAEARYSS